MLERSADLLHSDIILLEKLAMESEDVSAEVGIEDGVEGVQLGNHSVCLLLVPEPLEEEHSEMHFPSRPALEVLCSSMVV
jgi:hypothetical protein